MSEFGSSCRFDNRRVEIVSGRAFGGSNQIHASQSEFSVSPSVTRPSPKAVAVSSKAWKFMDPEIKRKKRIAKYKVYSVEGKVKDSLKRGFRWIRSRCSELVHGF